MEYPPIFVKVNGDVVLNGETLLTGIHSPDRCIGKGEFCTIHNPSPNPMRDWPAEWKKGYGILRLCPHRRRHPDADSPNARDPEHMEDCDGCCMWIQELI